MSVNANTMNVTKAAVAFARASFGETNESRTNRSHKSNSSVVPFTTFTRSSEIVIKNGIISCAIVFSSFPLTILFVVCRIACILCVAAISESITACK